MTHSRIVYNAPVGSINLRLTLLYLPHASTLRRVQKQFHALFTAQSSESLVSTASDRRLRYQRPPPSNRRLEVLLIAFQIETTVFKFLTVRFARPAERPTIFENVTTFQNCIALIPSVSGSLVSCQSVELGFRGHLPQSTSHASRVAVY